MKISFQAIKNVGTVLFIVALTINVINWKQGTTCGDAVLWNAVVVGFALAYRKD